MQQRHPCRPRAYRVLAAAVIAAILCSLGFAAGCSASTPESAVNGFISARIAGDDEKAAALTVEEDLTGYIGGEPFLYATDVTYEVEQVEAEVAEENVVVLVHYRWDDQAVDLPYVCRRIGSKWKVALRETQEMWFPEIEMEEEIFSP